MVRRMRVREVKDAAERARLWTLAVAAYPPYAEYQAHVAREDHGVRPRLVRLVRDGVELRIDGNQRYS